MTTEQDLREALKDMVEQFAYRDEGTLGPVYNTGGLSALEQAFQVLGWEDPHPVPERACEMDGCMKWGDCVGPKPDGTGFGFLCYPHFSEGQKP